MKLKHSLSIFGLVAMLGLGVGVGLARENVPSEARAERTQDSTLYFTGTINGDSHWDSEHRIRLWRDSTNTNLGEYLNIELKANDVFRFASSAAGYEKDCGWSQLSSSAETYHLFADHGEDNNIKVKADGTYNIYVNSSKGIYITFAGEQTYSYVLSDNVAYTNMYVYNSGEDKLNEWNDETVNVGSQAYDIKVNYGGKEYVKLFRINNKTLEGYAHLILRTTGRGSQTADLDRSSTTSADLFLCNGNSFAQVKAGSTAEYKAAQLLFNIATGRGAANYDSHDFAYSICAIPTDVAAGYISYYEGFEEDAASFIEGFKLFTYNVEGDYGEADANKSYQNVDELVDGLKVHVRNNGGGLGGGSRAFAELTENTKSNVALIAIIVGAVSLTTIGGYFFLRKRKEDR